MKKYFLHNGINQEGAFDIEDLKEKNITRETPIWYNGLSDWTTADKIEELRELFTSIPPVLGEKSLTPPPLQNQHSVVEIPVKKNINLTLVVSILVGLLILFFSIVYILFRPFSNSDNEYSAPKKETIQDNSSVVTQNKNSRTITPKNDDNTKPQTTSSIPDNFLGSHVFGVQFIWDGYGSSIISKKGGRFIINGEQYSNDQTEYTKINGEITILTPSKFILDGSIQIFTNDCCGRIDRTGTFTFIKTGNRKYWRLQERGELCDEYTCSYYLDIFE